jgi:hypothetical protein
VLDKSAVCTCDASTASSADTDPSPTTKLNSRIRSLSSALALISSGESKGARKQGGERGEGNDGAGWVCVGGSPADRGWVVG